VEVVLQAHLEHHNQELMVLIQLFQQLLQQEEEVVPEKMDQDLIMDYQVVLVEDLVIQVQVEQEIHLQQVHLKEKMVEAIPEELLQIIM
tara:strand:+ start:164 stop:430 length:267 start_codon:yes stop_codon:yes gene_type:complete